jgi:hypothetical protein
LFPWLLQHLKHGVTRTPEVVLVEDLQSDDPVERVLQQPKEYAPKFAWREPGQRLVVPLGDAVQVDQPQSGPILHQVRYRIFPRDPKVSDVDAATGGGEC